MCESSSDVIVQLFLRSHITSQRSQRLQFHNKRRPLPFARRLGANGAVMRLDHLLGHIETQAGAANIGAIGVVGPGKLAEEERQDVRRDADAGVPDGDHKFMLDPIQRQIDGHRSRGRVLDGIVDDVGEYLLQLVAVGRDAVVGAMILGLKIELQAALFDVGPQFLDDVLDQTVQVDGLEGVLHGTQLDAADVEVVIDDGDECLRGIEYSRDALARLPGDGTHVTFQNQ